MGLLFLTSVSVVRWEEVISSDKSGFLRCEERLIAIVNLALATRNFSIGTTSMFPPDIIDGE